MKSQYRQAGPKLQLKPSALAKLVLIQITSTDVRPTKQPTRVAFLSHITATSVRLTLICSSSRRPIDHLQYTALI